MEQEEKYMDEYIKEISEKIDSKKEYYAKISNKIWEFAEPRFQEYKSSELLQQSLKEEDFSVKANLAGEEIPIGARILRVCDVYCALSQDRSYRKAFDKRTVMELMIDEIKNFDLEVFLAFQRVVHTSTAKIK